MVRMKEMARELAMLMANRGFSVSTEAPKRVDDAPFIYLRLRDMRDSGATPGLCGRNVGVEIICSGGDSLSDEEYYAFYDLCTAAFLPYINFCGRSVLPHDISCDKQDGIGRYSFRLKFEDDVEPLKTAEEDAEIMGELIFKEEL